MAASDVSVNQSHSLESFASSTSFGEPDSIHHYDRRVFTIAAESDEDFSPRAPNSHLAELEASAGLVTLSSESSSAYGSPTSQVKYRTINFETESAKKDGNENDINETQENKEYNENAHSQLNSVTFKLDDTPRADEDVDSGNQYRRRAGYNRRPRRYFSHPRNPDRIAQHNIMVNYSKEHITNGDIETATKVNSYTMNWTNSANVPTHSHNDSIHINQEISPVISCVRGWSPFNTVLPASNTAENSNTNQPSQTQQNIQQTTSPTDNKRDSRVIESDRSESTITNFGSSSSTSADYQILYRAKSDLHPEFTGSVGDIDSARGDGAVKIVSEDNTKEEGTFSTHATVNTSSVASLSDVEPTEDDPFTPRANEQSELPPPSETGDTSCKVHAGSTTSTVSDNEDPRVNEAPTLKVEYVSKVWDAYINDFLMGSDHIIEAAIYDKATRRCISCSEGFRMEQREFDQLLESLSSLQLANRVGVTVGGKHYKTYLADGRRGIMAKGDNFSGCSACQTRTLVFLALHDRTGKGRKCNEEIMRLGDFFWNKGL